MNEDVADMKLGIMSDGTEAGMAGGGVEAEVETGITTTITMIHQIIITISITIGIEVESSTGGVVLVNSIIMKTDRCVDVE